MLGASHNVLYMSHSCHIAMPMETCKVHGTVSYLNAAAGPSKSSADFALEFNQHMDGLRSLATSIAAPAFVPPTQPHQFPVVVSPPDGSTAVAAFMAEQHRQLLLVVGLATAEGKHGIAVELLTQVSRLSAYPHASTS